MSEQDPTPPAVKARIVRGKNLRTAPLDGSCKPTALHPMYLMDDRGSLSHAPEEAGDTDAEARPDAAGGRPEVRTPDPVAVREADDEPA